MAFNDHRDGLHPEVNEDGVLSQHPGYNTGRCKCGATVLKARTVHVSLCLACQCLKVPLGEGADLAVK